MTRRRRAGGVDSRMSFGLGHGKPLDDAPGVVGIGADELPPLPDAALADPGAGRIDPRRWFAQPGHPFEIEIGPGKGTFLLAQGAAAPGINYLGVEWAREFYLYAADRVRRAGLRNVRLLRADAAEFLRWRCESGVARVIHLYFSDPWPKTRHHKNRVVQDRFLADAWRVLAPGGELRLVTDHDDLWAWYESFASRWTRDAEREESWPPDAPAPPFERRAFTPPLWVEEGEVVGTNFERKYRAEGRQFRSMVLVKR